MHQFPFYLHQARVLPFGHKPSIGGEKYAEEPKVEQIHLRGQLVSVLPHAGVHLLFFSATLLFIWTTGGIGLTGQKDTVSVRMTRRFLQLRFLLSILLIRGFFLFSPIVLLLMMLLSLLLILFQGMYYWTTLLRSSSEI
ncbi:MAG: hypothetical protein ABS939_17925 [Psychrobacillus sp.]